MYPTRFPWLQIVVSVLCGCMGEASVVYTVWGRAGCNRFDDTQLVYSGVVGGQHFAHPGGGSNYLCLTTEPVWGRQVNEAGDMATIYGAEYQVENNNVFAPRDVHDDNVPCAVCLATSRSAQIMLPGRNHCYPGWRREYWGYLMTEHHHHNGRTEYICVHVEADRTSAGFRNEDGALLYPVASRCGSLPCPPYFNHGELTCAVCTKA